MKVKNYEIGDKIRVLAVPPLVIEEMPKETVELFYKCVGNEFDIKGFNYEYELLELYVEDDGTQSKDFGKNTIWIEQEYVEPIS